MPEKSKWIDMGMYNRSGYYNLIQMRYRIDNNKKQFRTVSMGFVNDYLSKNELFKNVKYNNSESNKACNNFLQNNTVTGETCVCGENRSKHLDK